MLRIFLRYWLPVIIWTAVITLFSTDEFSARNTGSVIEQIVAFMIGHPLPPAKFELLHFVVRKLAHIAEYAILGALAFRAMRGDERGWNVRWAVAAVLLAAAVASGDELHQRFVPSRTASPIDVMIDTAGAILAQAACRLTSFRVSS
jgi:VanZ family protein